MEGGNPNASGQSKRDDSGTCRRCKWSYPNAKPSAKLRKNHKKKCGKIKGFEIQDCNGSSRGVSSEDNSSDDEKDNGPEISMEDFSARNMSNLSSFNERSDSPPALTQNFPESEKDMPEEKKTISENGVSAREYNISAAPPQDFMVESENDYKPIEINLHKSQRSKISPDEQNGNDEGLSKSELSLSVNEHNVEGKSGNLISLSAMEVGMPTRTLTNQTVEQQQQPELKDSDGEINMKAYPSVAMIDHKYNGFSNEIVRDNEPAKSEESINVSLPFTHDIETTNTTVVASMKLKMDTNVTENVVLIQDGEFNIETSIPKNKRKSNTNSAGNSEAVQCEIDIVVEKLPKGSNETQGNEDLNKKLSLPTSSASHDMQMEVGSESEKSSRLSVHHHLNERTSTSMDETEVMQEIDVNKEVLINQDSVKKCKEVITSLKVLDIEDSEIIQGTNCTSSLEKPSNVSQTRADNDARDVDKALEVPIQEILEDNNSLNKEEIQRPSQHATNSQDCLQQINPPPFVATSKESARIPQSSSLGNVEHGLRLPAEEVPAMLETSTISSDTKKKMFRNTVIENGEVKFNVSDKKEDSTPSLSKSEEEREEEIETGLLNQKGKEAENTTVMAIYSQEKMGSESTVFANPSSSMDLINNVQDKLIHSIPMLTTSDADVLNGKKDECLLKGGNMEEDEKSDIIKEESVKNSPPMVVNSKYDGQKGSSSNRILQKLESRDDFFSARDLHPVVECSKSYAISVTFSKSSASMLEESGTIYVDCPESLETCSVNVRMDGSENPEDIQFGASRRLEAAMFSTQSGKNSFIQVQVNKSQSCTRSVEEIKSADSRMDGKVKENKEEDEEKEATHKRSSSTAPNKEQGHSEGEELKSKSSEISKENVEEKRREEATSNEPLPDMDLRSKKENKQVDVKEDQKGSRPGSPINSIRSKPKKSPLWKLCMCSPAVNH